MRFFSCAVFVATLATFCLHAPEPARAACSGPCQTPEVRSVLPGEHGLTVVTNFGLIEGSEHGWTLVCEEVQAGLLLKAHSSETDAFVSMTEGLFTRTASCDWSLRSEGTLSDWWIDYSTSPQDQGYGLALDPLTQERVLQGWNGAAFEEIARFEETSGVEELYFDGDDIVISAFPSSPRKWQLLIDGGDEEWIASDVELDLSLGTVRVFGIREEGSGDLLATYQTPSSEPDLLLAVSSTTGATTTLLETARGERVGGVISQAAGTLSVALHTGATGRLVTLQDRVESASVETPPLTCLIRIEEQLFGCVNDFSGNALGIVVASNDDGQTWDSVLEPRDLAAVDDCGSVCAPTTEWLKASFGTLNEGQGGSPSAPEGPPSPAPAQEPVSSGESGCSLTPGPHSSLLPLLWLGVCAIARKRKK